MDSEETEKDRQRKRKYAAFDKLPPELRQFYREEATGDLDPGDALILSRFQTPEQVMAPIRTQMQAKLAQEDAAIRSFPSPGSVADRAEARSRARRR